MIERALTPRERINDYLYNLEAMTRKEAKSLWRQAIKDAWCNRCAYCDKPPIDDKSLTVDHVRPKTKGGEDKTSNCVPACARCNHSKGSENWNEWFRRQAFYNMAAERRIRIWIEEGKVVNEKFETIQKLEDLPVSGDIYDICMLGFKESA